MSGLDEQKTINDYKITYTGNSKNGNPEIKYNHDGISPAPTALTEQLEEQVSLVEVLDKYDDMKMNITNVSAYDKIGEYGIAHDWRIHGRFTKKVIRDEQYRAAKFFYETRRGFGILADTVGSGKTYEAGVVLSELAYSGKIKNLLIIVPNQDLLVKWKDVIEYKFGMGKDTLIEVKNIEDVYDLFPNEQETIFDIITRDDREYSKLNASVIVTKENFVKWNYELVKRLVFDCVVVDEAHYLNDEAGEGSIALKYISQLMENKKKQIESEAYCILLTATPHSGNLAKMFNLWYFITTSGGRPADFDASIEKKGDPRFKTYFEKFEKFKLLRRNAETVSEFVEAVKSEKISSAGPINRAFMEYLKKSNITEEEYKTFNAIKKHNWQEIFLNDEENAEINEEVLNEVSSDYHEIIESIMRRNTKGSSNGVKKDVTNVFICPVTEKTLKERKKSIEVARSRGKDVIETLDNIHTDPIFTYKDGSRTKNLTLDEYREKALGNSISSTSIVIDQVLRSELFEVGEGRPFVHSDSARFYKELLDQAIDNGENGKQTNLFRVMYDYDSENTDAIFEFKLKELVNILDKEEYKNDRVIVFFDYQKKGNSDENAEWNKIYEKLSKDPRFKDRLILARGEDGVAEKFNSEEGRDKIFLAGSERYTEGIDMQSGHVVINFSVTPDPLAMSQRVGRVYRLGQEKPVQIISLAMMNELEGYSLAYQNAIGLLSTNEGDATIIAGSNSENKIALECPGCGKTKLVALGPSDERQNKKGIDTQYCERLECSKQNEAVKGKGLPYKIIGSDEYKCNICGAKISKRFQGDKGYYCVSESILDKGKLYDISKDGKRIIGCSKLCAIKRCKKIRGFKDELGAVPCPIIEKQIDDKNEAIELCSACPNLGKYCSEKCSMVYENYIDDCSICESAGCRPKPHKIFFDSIDEAICPKCGKGRLKTTGAKTFTSYLYQSFAYNKGDAKESVFCNELVDETIKVKEIKEILDRSNREN